MIQEVLYRLYLKEFEEHSSASADEIYVSSLTLCPLKFFYAIKYPDIARITCYQPYLIVGKILHYGLERLLKEIKNLNFTLIDTEVNVEKRISIVRNGLPLIITVKGRIDILVKEKDSLIPVEIKTAKGDHNIPSEHHVLQLKIYMNMLNASKGILLYITPDRITEYTVEGPISDYDLVKLITNFLDRKGPRYPWECTWCIFNILCPNKKNSRR